MQIISSSVNQQFSGSIFKIQAIGNQNSQSTLSRLEVGNAVGRFNGGRTGSYSPNNIISTNVVVPNGSVIEGEFGRVKTGAGGFLIYLHD